MKTRKASRKVKVGDYVSAEGQYSCSRSEAYFDGVVKSLDEKNELMQVVTTGRKHYPSHEQTCRMTGARIITPKYQTPAMVRHLKSFHRKEVVK